MDRPESNAVFRVLRHGLVVIEHNRDRDTFLIVRPASLDGSVFRGHRGVVNVGMGGTSVPTNAPAASLRPTVDGRWLVDISSIAAPGPGPVWFRETFVDCADAVNAIIDCYFGDRVDNNNQSLVEFYGPDAPT